MANTEKYTMIVHPLLAKEGGGFIAYFPDLPGCMAVADTELAAVSELLQVREEWMSGYREIGRDIPAPGSTQRMHQKKRAEELKALKKVDEQLKKLDVRVDEIEKQIRYLIELAEDQAAGSRFDELTGYAFSGDGAKQRTKPKQRLHC